MDSPTALKYRHSFDSTCSCRRRGQSWAEALANAEIKLGPRALRATFSSRRKSGRNVSAQSPTPRRRRQDARPQAKPAKSALEAPDPPNPPISRVDTNLSQQAATISREASGIASGDAQTGARYGEGQGQTIEVVGPDGVKRRVRIIDRRSDPPDERQQRRQFGPGFAAGEREPQGMKEIPALAAGRALSRRRPDAPGRSVSKARAAGTPPPDRETSGLRRRGAIASWITAHQIRASSKRARLPRTAAQKGSASGPAIPSAARRSRTAANDS